MLLTVLTAASYLISALLLYSGTVGVLWPLHTARTLFAVPNATPDTATFYPGLAGRNVTCGLAILTLLLQGQKQAAGVVVGQLERVLYFWHRELRDTKSVAYEDCGGCGWLQENIKWAVQVGVDGIGATG
ncbi:hypothetical protein PSPO01_05526 [Paraphaeosphaeria sporulosa]